jgi:signal transduction histidine kinase
MVSHELRTPLTSIKEGINIVKDGSAGEINAEQNEFLELASRNLERLHRLINNVLDFSKLEARKAQFIVKENDINKVITEVVDTQSAAAVKKGLFLKTKLDSDIKPGMFDADKITQVLNNLINNAVKFTDNGGVTVLSSYDSFKKEIVVHVKDTGIGVKQKEQSQLFREFQQSEEDSFRKTGGSGLGLAICKQIIEEHKGKIWIESEYGKGSDFIFTLPV